MPFPVSNIRRLCALNGITLAELERELGIGNGVIARWETNKAAPPYDRLKLIADRFGVGVDDLSDGRPSTEVERVLEICKSKGIPIQGLENALGLPRGYLDPDKAKVISYKRMMEIAAFLNVPISDIIYGDLSVNSKKSPTPETGDEAERQELMRLYEAAPGWVQDQVRSLLKAAESAREAQGVDPKD